MHGQRLDPKTVQLIDTVNELACSVDSQSIVPGKEPHAKEWASVVPRDEYGCTHHAQVGVP